VLVVLLIAVGLPLLFVWLSRRRFWDRPRRGFDVDLWGDWMRRHALSAAEAAQVSAGVPRGRDTPIRNCARRRSTGPGRCNERTLGRADADLCGHGARITAIMRIGALSTPPVVDLLLSPTRRDVNKSTWRDVDPAAAPT
jgi:hypothetical protein